LALQITKAINYLHLLTPIIIHRDIKSMNFLINSIGDQLIVKLGDFGLAEIRLESSKQSNISNAVVGKYLTNRRIFS